MATPGQQLQRIRNFNDLVGYLEDELDWPLQVSQQENDLDDITFEYTPAELGLKDKDAIKVKSIRQLRPLQDGQPWGIFFVEFERKKLPVVVLRRILSHLVIRKRTAADKANAATWAASDILFISAFGDEGSTAREIAFAHFHQEEGDLPTLRVLGWDGDDTRLKMEYVQSVLADRLHWPDNAANVDAWRRSWSSIFRHKPGHVIKTADELAEALAALARRIRSAAQTLIGHESDHGALRSLHKAFQTALLHDLSEEEFADTYAQTITYGLLAAAIHRTDLAGGSEDTTLYTNMLSEVVPETNPFLREMLQAFLNRGGQRGGINFDELGIQDVVELLRGTDTDLPAILRDFGNKTQGEDPVIHFYEHFLAAYDNALKVKRGVFYTPKPVVSYIVRSVDEVLRTEFGIEDGLASTVTWGEMVQRIPGIILPKGTAAGSPFVVVLDIATGTATFLVEVIDIIHRTMMEKWRKQGLSETQRQAAWNEYVPNHLLPRLYGYELMMAPYAIAHMKIGLKLQETGYCFGSKERVRVYLTNALEPADDVQLMLDGILPALAHEAQAVNLVKRYQRFTVVTGNPPYSGHSANKGIWIGQLLRDYFEVDGAPLGERNPKWLQDDYVKFIRMGQFSTELTGVGVLALITNHSYLDNPTFRGMRQQLMHTFSDITVLDLHGNAKKKEVGKDGAREENVFDIQQGVAISLMVKRNSTTSRAKVRRTDLWGSRDAKYAQLYSTSIKSTALEMLSPISPFYLFAIRDTKIGSEYERFVSLSLAMPVSSVGFVTSRDDFVISFDRESLVQRFSEFRDPDVSDQEIRKKYAVGKLDVPTARANFAGRRNWLSTLTVCQYRPFDRRSICYAQELLERPRHEIMRHMGVMNNIALLSARSNKSPEMNHFFCTRLITETKCAESSTQSCIFPLYVMAGDSPLTRTQKATPNFSNSFLTTICRILGVSRDSFAPVTLFQYLYSVFHSPTYRNRYADFIKIDFPRIPLPSNSDLFYNLTRLGGDLVTLHLVEFTLADEADPLPGWPRYPRLARFSGGNRSVDKFPAAGKAWQDGRVAINASSGFEGVPEDVWNFQIGGYQVCHKWLKDRKGRTLSDEDILHYCKIVTALHETSRIMDEIDAVIEEHGGWPGAFAGEIVE